VNVKKCRSFTDAQKQFLAASPDGSIGNEAVAEVKCSYPVRDVAIEN
jgi:hypothetical protein